MTEHVMTMGLSPASQIAQRFANALMQAFLRRMDAAEASHLAGECEAVRQWLSRRAALEHDSYGTQARLWDAIVYCDDPLIQLVCVERAQGPLVPVAQRHREDAIACVAKKAFRVNSLL